MDLSIVCEIRNGEIWSFQDFLYAFLHQYQRTGQLWELKSSHTAVLMLFVSFLSSIIQKLLGQVRSVINLWNILHARFFYL